MRFTKNEKIDGGNKLKKKFITGLLAASLFVSPVVMSTSVSADSLEEMRQEKQRLENENQNIQNNINVQEETLKTLEEERASLEADVVGLQKEIDKVVRELAEQEKN